MELSWGWKCPLTNPKWARLPNLWLRRVFFCQAATSPTMRHLSNGVQNNYASDPPPHCSPLDIVTSTYLIYVSTHSWKWYSIKCSKHTECKFVIIIVIHHRKIIIIYHDHIIPNRSITNVLTSEKPLLSVRKRTLFLENQIDDMVETNPLFWSFPWTNDLFISTASSWRSNVAPW